MLFVIISAALSFINPIITNEKPRNFHEYNIQMDESPDSNNVISGMCGENVKFTFDENSILYITGTGDMSNYSNSKSPFINFKNEVTSIIINDEVTSIGSYSFAYFLNLQTIILGKSVNSIHHNSFIGCRHLKYILYEGNLEPNCPYSVFNQYHTSNDNQLVRVPSTYQNQTFCGHPIFPISKSQFRKMKLKFTSSDFLTKENNGAPSLRSKNSISENKKEILAITGSLGPNVVFSFDSSTGQLDITGTGPMDSSIAYSSSLNKSHVERVIIDNAVTTIGRNAFHGFRNMIEIEVGNNIESIGSYAFQFCENLQHISLPDSVVQIGIYAFSYCYTLKNFTIPPKMTIAPNHLLWHGKSIEKIIIPPSVTLIDDFAFCRCYSLKNITIPNSVTVIGDYGFSLCITLINISIPSSVYSIGQYAFNFCNFEYVTIPEGVKLLSNYSFRNCTNLKHIELPSTLIYIGGYAFTNCYNLLKIIMPKKISDVGSFAFINCTSLSYVSYPGKMSPRYSISEPPFTNCFSLDYVDVLDYYLNTTFCGMRVRGDYPSETESEIESSFSTPEIPESSYYDTSISDLDDSSLETLETSELDHSPVESWDTSDLDHSSFDSMHTSELDHSAVESMDTSEPDHSSFESWDTSELDHSSFDSMHTSELDHSAVESIDTSEPDHSSFESWDTSDLDHSSFDSMHTSEPDHSAVESTETADLGHSAVESIEASNFHDSSSEATSTSDWMDIIIESNVISEQATLESSFNPTESTNGNDSAATQEKSGMTTKNILVITGLSVLGLATVIYIVLGIRYLCTRFVGVPIIPESNEESELAWSNAGIDIESSSHSDDF